MTDEPDDPPVPAEEYTLEDLAKVIVAATMGEEIVAPNVPAALIAQLEREVAEIEARGRTVWIPE